MKTAVQIVVPRQFEAWERGFAHIVDDTAREALVQLQVATDLFFDATQRFVHIVSGALKATGEAVVVRDGDQVVGEVKYGDEDVVYAQIEEDRGGEHAYMSRGWEVAAGAYEQAMGRVWSEVVAGWQ